MNRPTALRIAIAVGSLIGGLIHIRLYFSAYRDVPIENLGRSFVLNAVAASISAVAVLVIPHVLALVAPLLVANLTLVSFGLSRTDRGILDFTERGWTPHPAAILALVVEIVTAAFCVIAIATEQPRAPARTVDPAAT